MMKQNNIDEFYKDFPLLNSKELSEFLVKSVLLTSYIKQRTEDKFFSILLDSITDGYLDISFNGRTLKHEKIINKLFKECDRYGRRKLISSNINFLEKEEFICYLKDILLKQNNDSCVLYMHYDSEFFVEMTHNIMSSSMLLGKVQYLSNVLYQINKKPKLVAFLFGFHCEKNQIWLQSSVEIKTEIYNMLK